MRSIPTANNHRVLIEVRQRPATDFEGLEDLGADAVRAARSALRQSQTLSLPIASLLRRELADLRRFVDDRALLSEAARDTMASLSEALRTSEDSGSAPVAEALDEALVLSERVADLLASEQAIGRMRTHPF